MKERKHFNTFFYLTEQELIAASEDEFPSQTEVHLSSKYCD